MRSSFSVDEQQRIDAAIAEVERSTTADLDIMVTRASDHYSLYPLVWAGCGALLLGGLATLFRADLSGRTLILIELSALIVLTPLLDWLPIRLCLIPTRVKRTHARQLGRREFDAHFPGDGFSRKRILFFVSLGEHYVEIIADHDTHARVPADAWNKIAHDFVAAVKVGHVADGLIAAIGSCGALLSTHYPGIGDDQDHLR